MDEWMNDRWNNTVAFLKNKQKTKKQQNLGIEISETLRLCEVKVQEDLHNNTEQY